MFAVHDKRLADALAAYRRRSADAVLAESLD
jgi:hypothetical protein